eukprot:TRINITY_DN75113_c0_g1_i2.p1 TRINITY_DN75113_c0_g1~~TRINITY_DN75113_c0_g1_i2.p1  ORF type:complete len:107 (-),score=31.75 TRINITY_DN75113_c0_g1_i2:80-400(-)
MWPIRLLLGGFVVTGMNQRLLFVIADAKSEAALAEFKQDFLDFDSNKDGEIDAQEVRAQFKGDLEVKELHQFFIDVDKDKSGTLTLEEYVTYATSLAAAEDASKKK